MQAKRFLLVVGLVGLLGAGAWAGMQLWSSSTALASADPQQRWEYAVVYNNYHQQTDRLFGGTFNALDSDPQLALNSAGATGWELVAVSVGSGGHTYFFKRPLP